MDATERERLEQQIRDHWDAGDLHAAATAGLRGYGPEIYGVLVSLHKDELRASDAFSEFTERLWRGLPQFQWSSSFRTWAFTIARNASKNLAAKARVRAKVDRALPSGSELEAIAEEVRTRTRSFLRTDVRDGLARLREALPADDQLLLVLRFDKELAWPDIARVLADTPLTGEAERREAARLRQRAQTLKRQLLEAARREGLV